MDTVRTYVATALAALFSAGAAHAVPGFPNTEFWFGALTSPGGTRVVATNSGTPVSEGSRSATPFPPPGITRDLAPYTAFADAGALPFYLLLDDSGGFNPGEPSDNDHDDMVVRLTALPVPEPGSGMLVLLGLVGCAADWRRRIRVSAKRAR
jgi:hypothetical protein